MKRAKTIPTPKTMPYPTPWPRAGPTELAMACCVEGRGYVLVLSIGNNDTTERKHVKELERTDDPGHARLLYLDIRQVTCRTPQAVRGKEGTSFPPTAELGSRQASS